jgi:hypothetical protein
MESDFPRDDCDDYEFIEDDLGDDTSGQIYGDGDEEINGTESKDLKTGNDDGDNVDDENDEDEDMNSNWSEEDPPRPPLEQWKIDLAKAWRDSLWNEFEAKGVELREIRT